MKQKPPKRKRIRLQRELYSDSGRAFSITICTAQNRSVFSDHELTDLVWKHLIRYFNAEATLYAACLMPDHVHLLVSPVEKNLINLLGSWKTYTAKLLKGKGVEVPLWQRSFYDHSVRTDEDLAAAARYIVGNPVRKGLCTDYRSYPFCYLRQ
ncbi:MAG: transposase [bacterium]|nr:transposase [bacterium]